MIIERAVQISGISRAALHVHAAARCVPPRRTHILLLLVVLLLALSPGTAFAAAQGLVYRLDGTACQPFLYPDSSLANFTYEYDVFAGLRMTDDDATSGNENLSFAVCPIMTGPNFVEASDDNGALLDLVRMHFRLQGANNETVAGFLVIHDNDSDDSCECDVDFRSGAAGLFSVSLNFAGDADATGCDTGCPSTPDTAWSINAGAELFDEVGGTVNKLVFKSIRVFAT